MLRFLSQIWSTISHLGTFDGMEFAFRRRIILSNQVSMLVVAIAACIGLQFLFLSLQPFGVFMASMMALIFLGLPVINSFGRFNLSRVLICLLPTLAILGTSIVNKTMLPGEVRVFQYFMPKFLLLIPVLAPLIMFDLTEKRRLAIMLLINLSLYICFDPIHRLFGVDAVQLGVLPTGYYYTNLVMFVIAASLVAAIVFLQRINGGYEQQVLSLLHDQQNISKELLEKERTLTEAFNRLQANEEAVRRNTHMLEEEIRQRKEKEKELIEERRRAESAAKAKEDFLSMMSHEIRTPMNAVIGMTHLLIEENPKPEQEENLKILRLSAENLLNLVNDILDFNKIEAGKIILEEAEFDLEELLLNIKSGFINQAKQKDIELRTFLDPGIPRRLLGDPVRISQVLYNLVSNAIKFTETGNVTVSIKSMEEDDQDVSLKFVVTDTGIGIARDKLESVFDSFVQANTGITRRFGGSGLGLSIVKRLLELMDSKILVRSEEGKGSEFSFILHLSVSNLTVEAASKPVPGGQPDLKGVRILVVEDNAVNQMVIKKFLRKWNAHMDTAHNGLEAINILKNEKYDLILMDLQMPEMDGFTATKKIRAMRQGNLHDIPIIALTASVQVNSKHRVFEVGMDDFVTKPFNPEELLQKIRKYTS